MSRVVPPIFVAHGAPGAPPHPGDAHARDLAAWAQDLPRPRGVLVVSAHWSAHVPTRGTTASSRATTLVGERVPLGWSPPGAPELAHELHELVPSASRDPGRGWDEGVWGPLRCMFPEADVPVLQLSLVTGATPAKLYALGQRLGPLAALGYLIVGSGAFAHDAENLSPLLDAEPSPYARAFDAWASNALADAEMDVLLRWRAEGPHARRANPTGEHLDPLFVVAGAASLYEHAVGFPVRGFARATVSLRCVQLGRHGDGRAPGFTDSSRSSRSS